jgi:hypothetical protein
MALRQCDVERIVEGDTQLMHQPIGWDGEAAVID